MTVVLTGPRKQTETQERFPSTAVPDLRGAAAALELETRHVIGNEDLWLVVCYSLV